MTRFLSARADRTLASRAGAVRRHPIFVRAAAACLLAGVALPATAQVSLDALDVPYAQGFDTLPATGSTTWTSNSTIAGWYSVRTGNGTTIVADAGTSNAGNLYSYGSTGSSDRALGTIGSSGAAAGNFFYGVRLRNDTGSTITSLDVTYVGEQWRNSAAGAQTVSFSYLIGAPTVVGDLAEFQATGTPVAALGFTSPITGGTAGALDGNAAANRTTRTATIDNLDIPNGSEIMLRWSDPDHTGSDHGLAIDDFVVTPHGQGGGAPSLRIDDVTQDEGNNGTTPFTFTVTLSAPLADDVNVDAVTADGTATAPSDYTAVPATTLTIPAGQTTATFTVLVNGDTSPEPDETFFVDLSNAQGGATIARARGTGTIRNDDLTIAKIHDVQGSGATTPMPGATVTVEAVVTGNFLGAGRLNGFFLQEEDADADSDPNTSEGIFIYCGFCAANAVAEGQRVRVTGVVSEFQGVTEITASSAATVVVTDAGNHLAEITPATISLPIPDDVDMNAYYEARESMLVRYDSTLTVSEYFQLFRFGQIQLVAGERPRQFTEDNAPDAAGYAAHLAALARRSVILDDDNNVQNAPLTQPSGSQAAYYPHVNGGLSKGEQGFDFFRGGDKVQNLTGILHWSWAGFGDNTWRIRPSATYPAMFTVENPRPATPPDVGGSIRVVGMNLLNYFTTIDTTASSSSGPCGPSHTLDCRGADSVAELDRQRERAANVICSLNPDAAAFMELENTTPADTINDLLGAVNARCGGSHPYAFANTGGTLGTDAIRVMIVYRQGVLNPVGAPLVDLDAVHSRPPMAQVFDVADAANPAFGKRFTVVANHLKSKGSCPASGADADQNDGQGCWAQKRTDQAARLSAWIDQQVIPAAQSDNVLLLGDFNSYASETPIATLKNAGYHDMEIEFHGTDAYSYLFDGELGHLDYALASENLSTRITGADAWHINADEVDLFDYNDEIRDVGEADYEQKPDGHNLLPARELWEPDTPYRASDHDPVVVGLFTRSNVSVGIDDAPDPVSAGGNITYTITITNEGPDPANVSWFDALPSGTNLVTYSGGTPEWSCGGNAAPSPQVGCENGAMAPGTAVFTVVASVDSQLPSGTIITNSVSLNPDHDTDPSDNTATATTTVAGAPEGHLTITPTSVDFGNQAVGTTSAPQTVTLKNDGTASLDVTTLTAAAAPFARSGGTCAASTPITIAAGAECTLGYTFAPSAAGAATQTLTVAANAPGSGSIALAGNGTQGHLTIAPTSVDFGDQTVGTTSAVRTVTLKNDGTASLDVTTLTAATAPFARSGGTCATSTPITIAAGGECTLGYTFAPSAAGAATQTLTVTANAPGSGSIALAGNGTQGHLTIAPTSVDFGDQTVGTTSAVRTVTLKNDGTASLDVTTLTAAAAPFARSGGTCAASTPITIAAGAECTLGYTFAPSAAGAATQTLTVSANAPGSGSIALAGTGVAAPPQTADIALAIDDGRDYVQFGETLEYVIEVSNPAGSATASVTVTDALPAGLEDGSWTCEPSGAASCAGGSGNTLDDVATLPAGTHVVYRYAATVRAGERIENTASATVGGGVTDPNPANNSASDSTVAVIFRDGFDDDATTIDLAAWGDGRGFVSALLTLDRAALARVGVMPAAIARGVTADGRVAFTLEVVRIAGHEAMRLTRRDADGTTKRSDWQALDGGGDVLDFAWQSATSGRADGYLRISGGGAVLQSSSLAESARLVRLRVANGPDGAPWLTASPY